MRIQSGEFYVGTPVPATRHRRGPRVLTLVVHAWNAEFNAVGGYLASGQVVGSVPHERREIHCRHPVTLFVLVDSARPAEWSTSPRQRYWRDAPNRSPCCDSLQLRRLRDWHRLPRSRTSGAAHPCRRRAPPTGGVRRGTSYRPGGRAISTLRVALIRGPGYGLSGPNGVWKTM
ncbi:MAG: hypothetical protein QOG79_7542 [Mycobacterium sp.]|jgi:hypothetical protein|nr:hypothetical protein [Mycobacterium sp.]